MFVVWDAGRTDSFGGWGYALDFAGEGVLLEAALVHYAV